MTLSNTQTSVTADGNGVTTQWNFTFPVPNANALEVTVTDNTVTPALTVFVPVTDYTVSGLGSPVGGYVTYPLSGSPLATGFQLSINRVVLLQQNTALANQGNFYPQACEGSFDYEMMAIQQLQAEIFALQVALEALVLPSPPTSGSFSVMTTGAATTLSSAYTFGVLDVDKTVPSATLVVIPPSGTYTIKDGGGVATTFPITVMALGDVPIDGITTGFTMSFNFMAVTFAGNGSTVVTV